MREIQGLSVPRKTFRRKLAGMEKRKPRRKTPCSRDPAFWADIRKDYEGGYTVLALAKVYVCTVSAIYRRIKVEGWVKPRPVPPGGLPPLDPPPEPPEGANAPETLADAIRTLADAAVRAVGGGRMEEAAALAGLAERLARLAARTERTGGDPVFTPARDVIALMSQRLGIPA